MVELHEGKLPEKQLLESDKTSRFLMVNRSGLRVPEIELSLRNKVFKFGNKEYSYGIVPVRELL